MPSSASDAALLDKAERKAALLPDGSVDEDFVRARVVWEMALKNAQGNHSSMTTLSFKDVQLLRKPEWLPQLADALLRRRPRGHGARAAIHVYGGAHEALVKRYMLYLEAMAKQKSKDAKKDHPPRVLFVREVLASLPAELTAKLKEMANGEEAVSTGAKCVLIKERRVMVVGLLISEWRLLLDKQQTGPADRLQLISGVEEAVVRGLSRLRTGLELVLGEGLDPKADGFVHDKMLCPGLSAWTCEELKPPGGGQFDFWCPVEVEKADEATWQAQPARQRAER